MLLDGEQLDVGVADSLHVFDQLDRHFSVGERFARGASHPGFEVDFVSRDRVLQPLLCGAGLHPFFVAPLVEVVLADDGGGLGRHFGLASPGVGFELLIVVEFRADEVLVGLAFFCTGDEDFPDAGIAEAHGMAASVPVVEVPGDGDVYGAGRPDGEAYAFHADYGGDVRAESIPGFVQGSFGVQVKIEIADDRAEAIGVFDELLAMVPAFDAEPVGHGD